MDAPDKPDEAPDPKDVERWREQIEQGRREAEEGKLVDGPRAMEELLRRLPKTNQQDK